MKRICLLGLICIAAFGADEALKPWNLDYRVSGGIAGRIEHLTIADNGRATAEGRREGRADFTATPEEMTAITTALRKLDPAGTHPVPPKAWPPAPDQLTSSLTIDYDGHKYAVDPLAAGFAVALRPILARGLRLAEEEKWTRAGPFRLGKVWEVDEEVRDAQGMYHGENWHGVWTRRGDTNTFDAVWRNNKTGAELRDTLQLISAGRGKIVLQRDGANIRYSGGYTPTALDKPSGYIEPSHGCYWRATIRY